MVLRSSHSNLSKRRWGNWGSKWWCLCTHPRQAQGHRRSRTGRVPILGRSALCRVTKAGSEPEQAKNSDRMTRSTALPPMSRLNIYWEFTLEGSSLCPGDTENEHPVGGHKIKTHEKDNQRPPILEWGGSRGTHGRLWEEPALKPNSWPAGWSWVSYMTSLSLFPLLWLKVSNSCSQCQNVVKTINSEC